MIKTLLTLTLVFLAVGRISAETKDTRAIEISIYAFAYAKGHQTIFLAGKESAPQEIELSNANILGPFKTLLDDEAYVTLRTRQTNEEDQTTIYPAIARAKVSGHIKEPLLVLVPGDGDQPYRALVMDRSLGNFPKGSYKLVNFSPSDIRALVGKTAVSAPSNDITTFDPSANSEELLDVHFQFKNAESWKTFGRTRWVNEKEKRSFLFAFLDPRTKRMKIRGIVVKPAPPKKKE
jgi:hypothetical protein